MARGGYPVRVVVRNHSNTYQKRTITSTKCIFCNGASLCQRTRPHGHMPTCQHANFFRVDRAPPTCTVTRPFVGDSEAGGGHLRRSGTTLGPGETPAQKASASTFIEEHEGVKPAIGGCGSRGSDGVRRAASPWQSGGLRRRAAARLKRLREKHSPAHLLR